ncbi:MAG: GNAT family N-acetyltransferase [Saprospiraceae bacterium]
MKIITTTELSKPQKNTIIYLWNREYPVQLNLTTETFEEYLLASGNHLHYLMLDDAAEIIGWACTFDRDDDKWFSILINSLYHGLGLGKMMLHQLKENETRLNGWVIDHGNDLKKNGERYESPMTFYLKNDFHICPDDRFDNGKMSAVKIFWEGLK